MRIIMLKKYMSTMLDIMKPMFPNMSREDLKNKIIECVRKNLNYNEEMYDIQFLESNDYSNGKINFTDLDRLIEKEQPILTGSGCLFKNHNNADNILGAMCQNFKDERSKYKKEMFNHVNDVDRTIYNNCDLTQRNMKILNNSFYGATNEPNSIFYDPNFGPSITYTGEDIIMTAMSIFEKVVASNFTFRNLDDIIIYINNIHNDMENKDKISSKIVDKVSIDDLVNHLLDHCVDKDINTDFIYKYLKSINSDDLIQLCYFKNNLFEFFNRSDILNKLFKKVIGRVDFKDPNNPPEDMISTMDKIWDNIEYYVFYNYQNFYRYDDAMNSKRRAVLTVDTDSNFIYLGNCYDYLKEKFPNDIDETDESIVCTVNLLTYQLTKVINNCYLKFTEELNVPEFIRPTINMKNEFLNKKIMLTKNKKNYASIVMMQEGRLFDNPKMDIKGLPIKKVSVNRNIRNYFTEILENDILKANKISLPTILYKYKKLENEIKESLLSGSTEYSIPAKVNEAATYKEPYSIMSFRATMIWNKLFPNQEIHLPTKVNVIKLNLNSYQEFKNYNESHNNIFDEYDERIKDIFEDEKLIKEDRNCIAIPKNIKNIPNIIIPFIKISDMVNTNIKSGMILLDSIGCKNITIKTNNIPSNIVTI